jgi:pterin-4a-carbinolamine dehydratase
MNTMNTVQELKLERVQEPVVAARKRVARPDDQGGAAVSLTRSQVEERLKSERVQLRLKRMQGWKMQKGGKAIDRVREFPDAQVAASYLAFAALLVRQAGLPLRASVNGNTIQIAVSGSAGRAEGVSEAVLDLAEQLG